MLKVRKKILSNSLCGASESDEYNEEKKEKRGMDRVNNGQDSRHGQTGRN